VLHQAIPLIEQAGVGWSRNQEKDTSRSFWIRCKLPPQPFEDQNRIEKLQIRGQQQGKAMIERHSASIDGI